MLLEELQKANAVVQLIPVVGDFVGKDEPLFALYGNVSDSTKICWLLLSTLESNARWSGSNFFIPDSPRQRMEALSTAMQ